MFYEFGIPLSASFNSSGGQNTCPSLLRRSSVFPCAFCENQHFGQEPAVTALIFYCPYPLRRCGRPERPVPNHHFLSPPTFFQRPENFRGELRRFGLCRAPPAHLPGAAPVTLSQPSPGYTLVHTQPTVGRQLGQRPSRLPGHRPASLGACKTGSLMNVLD